MIVWPASNEVLDIVLKVKEKYHHPRLQEANVALSFNDSKPFLNGRFNWGKTSKFAAAAKIWQAKKYDFQISLPADSWHSILNADQREAWIDLHLTRCQVDWVPVTVEENGKKKPVKDEWGRVQLTDEMKRDADGEPKWKLWPLDLEVFQGNVLRYGCWCEDLLDFQAVIHNVDKKRTVVYD